MAHLIIDGRNQGLPSAVTYYKTFPREPSPLGDIPLTSTTVMMNSSLDAALDAMSGAGAGGIVVLVCHAFQHGILLPIVSGGNIALAVADNMKIIDKVIAAEAEAATIRKLPISNEKEQKVMLDRWTTLLNSLQPGSITGTFTAAEAEAFFAKWLEMVATNLEFQQEKGKPRRDAMRQLIVKLLRVRGLKLSRLELRACNIGQDKTTMEIVRKFFGADHLTAPTVGTFFHGLFQISTMGQLSPSRRSVQGGSRLAGPLGVPTQDDIIGSALSMSQENHTTRGFLREMVVSISGIGGVGGSKGKGGLHLGAITGLYAFTLTVNSPKSFHYKASASVVSTGNGATPDWTKVKRFVQGWIMPGSTYETGQFPIAGLWTPDIADQPFVLPNETVYTKLIEQVP